MFCMQPYIGKPAVLLRNQDTNSRKSGISLALRYREALVRTQSRVLALGEETGLSLVDASRFSNSFVTLSLQPLHAGQMAVT